MVFQVLYRKFCWSTGVLDMFKRKSMYTIYNMSVLVVSDIQTPNEDNSCTCL